VATLLFCAPVYVIGLGLLLLFNHDIGIWPVRWFFDALPAGFVSPTTDPWGWFRAYLVPWIIVAAPLAAACLRLTARLTVEELDTDHVRTAIAKGLPYGYVVRHHAARAAYPSVTSLVWSYVPVFVTNIVFVEWVWNVPGFWFATRRALDQDPNFPGIDVPMLKAISLWTALIIVVLSVAADITLAALDPRVRSAGRV
jgi:peptide/nickel transport system permease protein